MKIDKFKVEYWLNPLDDKAKYNLVPAAASPLPLTKCWK